MGEPMREPTNGESRRGLTKAIVALLSVAVVLTVADGRQLKTCGRGGRPCPSGGSLMKVIHFES